MGLSMCQFLFPGTNTYSFLDLFVLQTMFLFNCYIHYVIWFCLHLYYTISCHTAPNNPTTTQN